MFDKGNEQAVVNVLGHAAGVLIFGIFLYLVIRERSAARLRVGWLQLTAAALALLWNVASLVVLVMGSSGSAGERVVAAFGFSVLSVLPAVLLQLCLVGRFRVIVQTGYVLGTLAVAAHILEFVQGEPSYHRIGLSLISIGFGVLTALAVFRVFWFDQGSSRSLMPRILATMSLFLLAISFGHFGEGHTYQAWSEELAIHHAGIPLALFVLLQEFRFVLLDAFVRFLVNGLLAGLCGLAIAAVLPRMTFFAQALTAGLFLTLFAVSRELVQRFLTRIIFRQPNPESTAKTLQSLRADCASEADYVPIALQRIAELMGANLIDIICEPVSTEELVFPALASELPEHRHLLDRGVRAIVPVRLTHSDTRYGLFGERKGGQPYLSEDLLLLARMAAVVAEQVQQIREAEVTRLVSQAELRALQSQIHPHFLFNALNTLYGVIPREASGARRMLLSLADIFRYFLQSDRTFVPLEEEMRIVEAYLSIERMRLGDRLKTELDLDERALREQIPVLSIQPLVENAVKHGAAASSTGGCVRVEVKREESGVRVSVTDTGPGFGNTRSDGPRSSGVGLDNVSRRLSLCYGPEARVSIESDPAGSRVSFFAPCQKGASVSV
jgi:two-component system, LytTR family, sensor kinase